MRVRHNRYFLSAPQRWSGEIENDELFSAEEKTESEANHEDWYLFYRSHSPHPLSFACSTVAAAFCQSALRSSSGYFLPLACLQYHIWLFWKVLVYIEKLFCLPGFNSGIDNCKHLCHIKCKAFKGQTMKCLHKAICWCCALLDVCISRAWEKATR